MQESSWIVIEEYCRKNPKTKKSAFLSEMVEMSYGICCEASDWQMMNLSQLIARKKNPELLEALENLEDFMIGW